MKNTAKLFGREIPLKKDGGINKTFLKKEERTLLKEYQEKLKKQKKDIHLKELEEFFSK
jgi:hypothetical protein